MRLKGIGLAFGNKFGLIASSGIDSIQTADSFARLASIIVPPDQPSPNGQAYKRPSIVMGNEASRLFIEVEWIGRQGVNGNRFSRTVTSIKSLVTALFGLYLVWLLAWSDATHSLADYRHAAELAAYLHLREFAQTLPNEIQHRDGRILDIEPSPWACDRTVDFYKEGPSSTRSYLYQPKCPFIVIRSPDSTRFGGYRWEPLVLAAVFPIEHYVHLRLYRQWNGSVFIDHFDGKQMYLEDGKTLAEFFDVETDDPRLPFSSYEIAHLATETMERYTVSAKGDYFTGHVRCCRRNTKESFMEAALREQPLEWEDIKLLLVKYGIAADVSKLTSQSKGVRAMLAALEISGKQISLLGLSVPVTIAMSAFGLVVFLVTTQLLGPMGALHRNRTVPFESDWIFLYPVNTISYPRTLQAVLTMVSVAFGLMPIAFVFLQLQSGVFDIVPLWVALGSVTGALASAAILIRLGNQLRKRRGRTENS